MKILFLSLTILSILFASTIQNPTKIVTGEIYDYDLNTTMDQNKTDETGPYYSFTMTDDGNIFISNPNPDEAHIYRIYDENFNLVESDTVKDSRTESLYEGRYLYHNVKGAFSIHSDKIVSALQKETKKEKSK